MFRSSPISSKLMLNRCTWPLPVRSDESIVRVATSQARRVTCLMLQFPVSVELNASDCVWFLSNVSALLLRTA
jgi:hypothetical protein